MEVVAAAVVVSLAYVYAPILRVHAARRLRFVLPANAVAPGSPAVVPPTSAELPAGVEKWCRAESEEWAQNEMRERAKRLYAEHGDWDVVLNELERIA